MTTDPRLLNTHPRLLALLEDFEEDRLFYAQCLSKVRTVEERRYYEGKRHSFEVAATALRLALLELAALNS